MNIDKRFRCVHGHTNQEHPNCYKMANGKEERVGFCDIETSNLNATFGIIYTFCIKELDGEIYKYSVSTEDLYRGEFDKNLLKNFIETTEKFTRLVVHYGSDRKFDLPFLRSRAVYWGLPFPEYKFLFVSDTYNILKNKFKLHSNRLETACDFFHIPAKKHKLNSDIWLLMITGNPKLMKKALDYIMVHNIEDVISLERLWKKISKFTRIAKTSI